MTRASGYLDAHLHTMAFEFLGGRVALRPAVAPATASRSRSSTARTTSPAVAARVLEHVLSGTDPAQGHDTVGWPTFGYWPKHDSLTHEQVYYKWLERSWRGGLRHDDHPAGRQRGAVPARTRYKKNSCNEMDGVRLQAQRLRELERYIDAQSGGPGRGLVPHRHRPVRRRAAVINSGRLAVVMGIEVSVLFDCGCCSAGPALRRGRRSTSSSRRSTTSASGRWSWPTSSTTR